MLRCKFWLQNNYSRFRNLTEKKTRRTKKRKLKAAQVDYILEPSQEEIVEQLIPKNIKTQVIQSRARLQCIRTRRTYDGDG
jgi:F0F1-type ATP synthase gamma subunit